ncbi:M28 family metallopeptidase [Qipengyuania gelatinilytica]|uniref:Zn-dependent exopeptidase M28 n=1 Tax=Qipengyuania gelatinilytica TaxID=2867231 RepID=A0ABX9A1L9_9SPHN|nr:M28 family metallopeptidase [Qipengyuania gelatinilytica]QZD95162.1 Zn-dependent exopeptidase M28 [Qipengyuania gelatinilytica]
MGLRGKLGIAAAGLAGFLIIAGNTQALRATEYATGLEAFIGERVTTEQRRTAAVRIMSELAEAGIEARLQSYDTGNTNWALDLVLPPVLGANVAVEIPSTEPSEQTIVIGAHYDTVKGSPGADDNASGTYAVIELAKRVSEMPMRRMNVVFVWFDQEEIGLVGSKIFAANWKASGLALHSMHNIDMIGFDGNGDGRFDLDVPEGELAEIYLEEAEALGIPIARDTFNSSDHASFRKFGFRAVCLSEDFSHKDINPTYHRRGDKTIDREYMQSGIDLVAAVMKRLLEQ